MFTVPKASPDNVQPSCLPPSVTVYQGGYKGIGARLERGEDEMREAIRRGSGGDSGLSAAEGVRNAYIGDEFRSGRRMKPSLTRRKVSQFHRFHRTCDRPTMMVSVTVLGRSRAQRRARRARGRLGRNGPLGASAASRRPGGSWRMVPACTRSRAVATDTTEGRGS